MKVSIAKQRKCYILPNIFIVLHIIENLFSSTMLLKYALMSVTLIIFKLYPMEFNQAD